MIQGYKKVKDCEPGDLIRFEDGEYAVISEYRSNGKSYDGYIVESGEALHANPDIWVAIIDIDFLESNMADEVNYPQQPAIETVESRIWINGTSFMWNKPTISFEDVIALARQPSYASVIYTRGHLANPSGTLMSGKTIKVRDGMNIDAVPTGNS